MYLYNKRMKGSKNILSNDTANELVMKWAKFTHQKRPLFLIDKMCSCIS